MFKKLFRVFTRKKMSIAECIESAKTISQATNKLITLQLTLAERKPTTLLTNDVLPFFLGYVWGFSDSFAQYFAESTNKKYDQSVSTTTSAQVLEQMFGVEKGESLFNLLWTLSGGLFDIGQQRGAYDVSLFVTKKGALSLTQFLIEHKSES
ncbi:hypothetical protein [Sulfurirhabdus autotrophica]|uniref:Uncharacterized protein n=1 Tax=Sulfurirhabdus autotrophica TaxID=1706046 RepID=A0A4R3XR41_9PROT|nr:hypothetical protein [Sulfurirhabdus autotrophica]TCV81261.1 hypothetical protein EDC63_1249 [Sulfurirhabdus autotrophica]